MRSFKNLAGMLCTQWKHFYTASILAQNVDSCKMGLSNIVGSSESCRIGNRLLEIQHSITKRSESLCKKLSSVKRL